MRHHEFTATPYRKRTIVKVTCLPLAEKASRWQQARTRTDSRIARANAKGTVYMSTIITVVLVIVLIAALPFWKYIKPYDYTPTIWAAQCWARTFIR